MSNFRIGQKVVSTKSNWNCGAGPKKGEPCTIDGFVYDNGECFLFLAEYNFIYQGTRIEYNQIFFESAQDDFAESTLATIAEQIEKEQFTKPELV